MNKGKRDREEKNWEKSIGKEKREKEGREEKRELAG